MRGEAPDLNNVDPEDKTETLAGYERVLQATSRALDSGFELDDTQQTSLFQQLNTMSRHQPDEINSRVRQQMNRVASNADLMKMFEQTDERGYRNFTRAVAQHQLAEIESLQEDMDNKNVRGSRYYLKQEEEAWMIVPTTQAIEKFSKQSSIVGTRGQVLKEGKKDTAEKFLRDPVQAINMTRGLLTNMIKARAIAARIPEAEAARQISSELGMNLHDVTVEVEKQKEERPGFAEEAGVE